MTRICERCQCEVAIGAWPWCPHGVAASSAISDTIIGGQTIETLDHDEMTFYSKKAIRDAADARGLRLKDEWAGPHDTQLTNWAAAIDAYTLEAARVLTSRGSHVTAASPDQDAALQSVKTWVKHITQWSDVEGGTE